MSWQLEVAPTRAQVYEAMVDVGTGIARGRSRICLIVYSVFVFLFAPMGATMIFWVAVQLAGGPDFADLPAAVIPLTLLAFGAAAVWLSRRAQVLMADLSVRSRFGSRYTALLDGGGLTLMTAHSRWQTGWADVATVCGGKTTLAIGIAGIAIALPRSAFADPQDAADALEFARQRQEAAQ
jgi:hypothetical protein